MMEAPCQKVARDLLPAIRAAIAVGLVRCGMSPVSAAEMLEIAPSAVSKYLSGKRGYRIWSGDEGKQAIGQLAQDFRHNRVEDPAWRICDICRQLRKGGDICGRDPDRCVPERIAEMTGVKPWSG